MPLFKSKTPRASLLKTVTTRIKRLTIALCLCTAPLLSAEVTLDLQKPLYTEGTLSTSHGGVLTAPNFRLQAREISYSHTKESVTASGDLMLEYNGRLFTGDSITYNFATHTGQLLNGRVGLKPWFLGGAEIDLLADGSFYIRKGYATTCESCANEWRIEAADVTIDPNQTLTARNIKFKLFQKTFFWVPRLKMQTKSLEHPPVSFAFDTGGLSKGRIGMRYRVYSTDLWNIDARADYRLARGFGAGLNIDYGALHTPRSFAAHNYIARDISISDPKKRTRYRLQGVFYYTSEERPLLARGRWDRLSDVDMAADYRMNQFNLPTAQRTTLDLAYTQPNWLLNAQSAIRINSFQTVGQKLPLLTADARPFSFDKLGLISYQRLSAGYLHYSYSNLLPQIPPYSSSRGQLLASLERPIPLPILTLTPFVGISATAYGNGPAHHSTGQTVGMAGLNVSSTLSRTFSHHKHTLQPYAEFTSFMTPRTALFNHYIFSIDDAYTRFDQLRLGLRNNLFTKTKTNAIVSTLFADLYTYGFFHTQSRITPFPRLYATLTYLPWQRLSTTIQTAWNFQNDLLDFFNAGIGWTAAKTFAISLEYLYRSAYAWQKSDPTNFVLDATYTNTFLRQTRLSDPRKTILTRFSWLLSPALTTNLSLRWGWRRPAEPSYFEYQLDVITRLLCQWNLTTSYEHRVGDDRFTVGLSLGGER